MAFRLLVICLLGCSLVNFSSSSDALTATAVNQTSDNLHITCDTMSFTMPGVNVLFFQDVASNATNVTVLNGESEFNISALDDGLNSENETGVSFDYTNLDDGLGAEEVNSTVFDYSQLNDGLDAENSTEPENGTDTLMFNDEVKERMMEMGFPFKLSCQMQQRNGENWIEAAVTSVDNSTQIVEILTQVHVGENVTGEFVAPEMSQDYRVACSGQAVSHLHSDPKERMVAQWHMNSTDEMQDSMSSPVCVFSVLDTNGNFWQMLRAPASVQNSTEETESLTSEIDTAPTTTDAITTGEEAAETTQPAVTTTQDIAGDSEKTGAAEEMDFEIKSNDETVMGDMGEIAIDGQTYKHHCINNNMIRALVPYTGCSDYLTVVGGLPRAYQTCGLETCFDANDCDCKSCDEVTCEKLAPGSSQSYSISIYNNEGKEVGVVSGERTRTLSGGLSESISARGDPRSSLFPIEMK